MARVSGRNLLLSEFEGDALCLSTTCAESALHCFSSSTMRSSIGAGQSISWMAQLQGGNLPVSVGSEFAMGFSNGRGLGLGLGIDSESTTKHWRGSIGHGEFQHSTFHRFTHGSLRWSRNLGRCRRFCFGRHGCRRWFGRRLGRRLGRRFGRRFGRFGFLHLHLVIVKRIVDDCTLPQS